MDQTQSKHLFLVTKTPGGPTLTTNWTVQFPPETTPLLLDYDEFHPRPPESGKNAVYMDGHVAPLDVSSD
jgi:prepilin-type processing-associated H-X9-DG protein